MSYMFLIYLVVAGLLMFPLALELEDLGIKFYKIMLFTIGMSFLALGTYLMLGKL